MNELDGSLWFVEVTEHVGRSADLAMWCLVQPASPEQSRGRCSLRI